MKSSLLVTIFVIALISCKEKNSPQQNVASPISGTWELVSSKVITKNDTSTTFPVKNQKMIKIFNDDSFAFFRHDTHRSPGDSAVFVAGSGKYTLNGENYSEHLEYCNYREWENRDFTFNLQLHNDTLVQTGIEKIDSLQVDQKIIEIYVRKM